jgi:hypothetical protein
MGHGGSGTGWSMSIWPRWSSTEGQDRKYFPHDPSKNKRTANKKRPPTNVPRSGSWRRDDQKFKNGIIKAFGPKAAKRFIDSP